MSDIPPSAARDPVADLIVCAAKAFATGANPDECARACERIRDWGAVRDAAVAHGVLPIVHRQLRALDDVPGEALAGVDRAYRWHVARTLLYMKELEVCLAALNARGLEPIVLKGPALGLALYGDPVMRPFSDVDVLLAEEDWPRFRDALLSADASVVGPDVPQLPPRLDPAETLDHWLTFCTAGGLAVECTFDPLQLGVRTQSLGRFLDTARPLQVGPWLARTLAPEENLLALCLHLNRHGFTRLGWWADIALLIERNEAGLDWEAFCALALREGVAAPVALTLERVEALFGRPSVPIVRERLRPTPVAAAVWGRFWPDEKVRRFEGLHEGPLVFYKSARRRTLMRVIWWNVCNLLLTGRVREKLGFVARWLFPPKAFLSSRQGMPGASYPRLWLSRLVTRGGARRADAVPAGANGVGAGDEAEYAVDAGMARGVAWSGASRILARSVQFVVTVVLARLLVPADFGLAGMAAIVTMLVALVTEFGFGTALIQKPTVSPDDVSTSFSVSLVLGVVMFLFCLVAAEPAAAAFHNAAVARILEVSAFGLVIGAFAIVPRAILARRLDFRAIAAGEIGSSVAYGASSIGLALAGFGVWSLVVAGLVLSGVRSLILLLSARVAPSLRVSRKSLGELLPFGLRMLGANLLSYARGNIDYFVVGSALGAAPLGLYTLAFKLADFPRVRLAASITDVALPALSALQDERDRCKRVYFQSLAAVAFVALPLLTGLAMIASDFVRLMYGERWSASVAPLQILLLMGILLALSEAATTLIVALGHPGLNLRLSGGYFAAVAAFAVVGLRWGIVGVAAGVSLATALYFVAQQAVLFRVARVHPLESLRQLRMPVLASLAMVATLAALRLAGGSLHGFAWLAGAVASGAVVYGTVVLFLMPPAARQRLLRRARAVVPGTSAADRMSA